MPVLVVGDGGNGSQNDGDPQGQWLEAEVKEHGLRIIRWHPLALFAMYEVHHLDVLQGDPNDVAETLADLADEAPDTTISKPWPPA